MENIFYEQFVKWMGPGEKYSDVSKKTLKKYSGAFQSEKDESDIVRHIWLEHGLRGYKDGLFWFVDPDEYTDIGRSFPNISKSALVFARTYVGNLFLFDRMKIGDSILYLNVHKGEREIVSTGFETFLAFDVASEDFWKRECYGKVELKAIKKHGAIAFDECVTFIPALALGGSESIKSMEKVKLKENLELQAQMLQ